MAEPIDLSLSTTLNEMDDLQLSQILHESEQMNASSGGEEDDASLPNDEMSDFKELESLGVGAWRNLEGEPEVSSYSSTMGAPWLSDEELVPYLEADDVECLAAMRQADPFLTSQMCDHYMLLFVWGRKYETARCLKLLSNHVKWREAFGIDKLDKRRVRLLLGTEYVFHSQGNRDLQGNLVLNLRFSKLDVEVAQDVTNIFHGWWWFLVDLYRRPENFASFRSGAALAIDFSGLGFRFVGALKKLNAKAFLGFVQNSVPMRIRRVYLFHLPGFYSLLWGLIKNALKRKLRRKIIRVPAKQHLTYFEAEHLMPSLGGTLAYSHREFEARAEYNS